METQIEIIVNESKVLSSEKKALVAGFDTYEAIAKEWETKAKEIIVTDSSQKDMILRAKEGRKFLKEKRLEIEKNKTVMKEQSLRKGQAIDAIARYLIALIKPSEEYLESQEKFAEIQEEDRLMNLEKTRSDELGQYTDTSIYNFRIMSEDVYQTTLNNAKKLYEADQLEKVRIEDERIAKEKVQNEEQQRIRKENEELRAKAVEQERQNAEKIKVQNKKLQEEREARERAEKELQDKEEKERQIKRDEAKKVRQSKLAPDKDKLKTLASNILGVEYPEVQDVEAKKILDNVKILMQKVNIYIIENIERI